MDPNNQGEVDDDYGEEFDNMVKKTEEALQTKEEAEQIKKEEQQKAAPAKKSFLQNMVFDAQQVKDQKGEADMPNIDHLFGQKNQQQDDPTGQKSNPMGPSMSDEDQFKMFEE